MDREELKDFLGGKLSWEDNLTVDFVHGFASAMVFIAINSGGNPLEADKLQTVFEDLVDGVLAELRGAS